MTHQTNPLEKSDDTLLSPKEMMALTGLSNNTLCRWRGARKGPPFIRLSSTKVAYRLGDYRTWCDSQVSHSSSA